MAAFTVVLAALAFFQWRTSDNQALTTRMQLETQRAELRAYVSFKIKSHNEPSQWETYKVVFECENHGSTPATEIGFRAAVGFAPFPYSESELPIIAEGYDEGRANLFPDEKMGDRGLGFQPDTTFQPTDSQMTDYFRGKLVFVIGLRIKYTDAFFQTHVTEEFWGMRYDGHRLIVSLLPQKSRIT